MVWVEHEIGTKSMGKCFFTAEHYNLWDKTGFSGCKFPALVYLRDIKTEDCPWITPIYPLSGNEDNCHFSYDWS